MKQPVYFHARPCHNDTPSRHPQHDKKADCRKDERKIEVPHRNGLISAYRECEEYEKQSVSQQKHGHIDVFQSGRKRDNILRITLHLAADRGSFAIQMSDHTVQNADGYCKNNAFNDTNGHFYPHHGRSE